MDATATISGVSAGVAVIALLFTGLQVRLAKH